MSLVNKTNNQFSRVKLESYGKNISGCGNLKGGNKNLTTASYGYVDGNNNRMFANSRPEITSLSKPQQCNLTGGRKNKTKRRKQKTAKKRKLRKRGKSKKRKTIPGKKLLKKWIKQIKKFKRRTMRGGSKGTHFVYQTPGNMNGSRSGMFANPTSYTVNNKCVDNYNHYKR